MLIAVTSLVLLICRLATTADAVGAYYPPVVSYGGGPAGYLLPAYVPPYAAYHVAPAGAAYGQQQNNNQQSSYDDQQDTKYYYGGKFQGTCSNDGLYYKDDTTFVICSNSYASEQPCPPGTKTAGYPSYQAGYYYGYTDLCSVNLVDYGYGPSSYAADDKKSQGYKQETSYNSYNNNNYARESYSTPRSASTYTASAVDSYAATKPSYQAAPAPYPSRNAYGPSRDNTASYGPIKETYPSSQDGYTTKSSSYQPSGGAYGSQSGYQRGPLSNPYVTKDTAYPARDATYPSGNAYPPKAAYQEKETSYSGAPRNSYEASDTVYSQRSEYANDKRY